MNLVELFGGIGACSKALKNLGIEHTLFDYVENDKKTVECFNLIHGTNFKAQDVRNINYKESDNIDLIMGGSPCQDFSLAGKQLGADENSKTRSSLMWEQLRIIKECKPKITIWENVSNVLNKRHKPLVDKYCQELTKIGYLNIVLELNAKDFGIPQNRKRIFIISMRDSEKWILTNDRLWFLQKKHIPMKSLGYYLMPVVDEWYYVKNRNNKYKEADNYLILPREKDGKCISGSYNRVWKDYIVGTVAVANIPKIITDLTDKISNNLLVVSWKNKLWNVRILHEQECMRLMGFDDTDYFKLKDGGTSRSRIYKVAGNSIVVNVLMEIFKILYGGNNESRT